MAAADIGSRARWPAWTLGLAFAAFAALTAWLVWRIAILQPYTDQLDWLSRYEAFRQDGRLAAYLLTPHNLHRMAFTFAIQAADARLGASNILVIGVAVACLLTITLLLALLAARTAPTGLALGAAVVAAMLCLGPGVLLDAATPVDSSYLHALLFVVLAVILGEPPGPAPSTIRRLAVLFCATAAGFGVATGLAVWPVLIFAAWRGGQDRRWVAVLVLAAAVDIALYFHGQALGGGGRGAFSHGGLGAAASLAMHFLGLPWTRAAPMAGALLGFAILVGGLAAVAGWSGRHATRAQRIGAALILFSLGAAAMAALGRSGVGDPADVSLRYAGFLLPAHVGAVLLVLPYLARPGARVRGETLLAAAAVALLAQQAAMGAALVRVSDVNRAAVAAFRAGDRSAAVVAVVHPDPAAAAAVYARLRAQGIYQRELHLKPKP